MGSASELEYHLLLANDLGLIHSEQYDQLARQTIELKRMLAGLLKTLACYRSKPIRPHSKKPASPNEVNP